MIKKNSILLLGTISVLLIMTFMSATNVFAQGYSTPHSVPKLPSCFQSASPKVDWSNCIMAQNQYHFSDMAGANLSGTVMQNPLFYDVNLSGANMKNSILSGGDFSYSNLSGA
ncbi:MAG: pentapeptide repeat-containing protein, partial [Nitrosotalea sp.]